MKRKDDSNKKLDVKSTKKRRVEDLSIRRKITKNNTKDIKDIVKIAEPTNKNVVWYSKEDNKCVKLTFRNKQEHEQYLNDVIMND